MSTGTEYVLVAAVCGILGVLLSIGINLKRVAAAREKIAGRNDV